MKKRMFFLVCGMMSALLISGFAQAQSKVPEVRIGAPLSITGGGAYAGQTFLEGAQLAIDEINAAGGIKSLGGAKLRFIKADSKTDPKTAGIVTESLITKDKVHFVWGEYTTGATLVVQDICEKYGVPNLSVAGSPIITGRGLKWAFRTQPHLGYWHEVAFELFKEFGIKNAVIATDSSAYGQANRKVYQTMSKENGIKILLDEVYEMSSLDLSPLIIKLGAVLPDAVLAAPYLGDAVLLVRQMRENNANFPLVMGMATGFSDLNFRKRAGSAGDYIMDAFTYHNTLPGPENEKFVKVFQKKYGFLPDAHHQWGYTDMYVIANALQRAASTDPADILKALKGTDMMTPCGRVKFGPDGQNHEYKGIVIQWLNEKIEVIWPKKYATAKPVYPMPTWDKRR